MSAPIRHKRLAKHAQRNAHQLRVPGVLLTQRERSSCRGQNLAKACVAFDELAAAATLIAQRRAVQQERCGRDGGIFCCLSGLRLRALELLQLYHEASWCGCAACGQERALGREC